MPPLHRPQTEAAEALAAVAPLATRWIERVLARSEPPLTVTQYLALGAISAERISGTELARRAGVSGAAVSQLLGGLVDTGLLERRPVAEDRRRQTLALSSSGERALQVAGALLNRQLGALLTGLARPEVDALARLLPRVEAALSRTPPPPRGPGPGPPPGPHPRPPAPAHRP